MLALHGSLAGFSQRITLTGNDFTLPEIFSAIESQTGYSVLFSIAIINNTKPVSINVTDMPLKEFLTLVLKDQPLKYVIEAKTIFIQRKALPAQTPGKIPSPPALIDITGKVLDKNNNPLHSVSITIKGTGYGVASDLEGEFKMEKVDPKIVLVFSYVGLTTIEEKLNGRTRIIVKMAPANKMLDGVVVSTGYQKIEQKHLTGSVTTLKMDSIIQPGITTIDKMLEGRVPGMMYMMNSGQAGAVPRLRIRGTSTLLGSREPLWVVDGIVRNDPVNVPASKINDLDFVNLVGNAISGLNPNDIDQIDVLKDAAATALYGVRAANGVIVITTKRGRSGPPTINYTGSAGFVRRPRYTDRDIYLMNSQERVSVSREMIDKQLPFLGVPEGYEKAMIDYYNGVIDYDTYKKRAARAETMNTDWFDVLTRDAFSSAHTLSISGGNPTSQYYASMGYTSEPGVIKGEQHKRYTGEVKFDVNYKNFKAQFSIDANKTERRYTPQELTILDYAYRTSRAISLYNEDGSLYYYDNGKSGRPDFNVLNEMKRSGLTIDGSSYTAAANLYYQVIPGLQLRAVFSYAAGNTDQRTWFEEKTNWVSTIRGRNVNIPANDPLPFGGELKQETNRQSSYSARGQADFSKYLDGRNRHLVTLSAGTEISSLKNSGTSQVRRGYYPDRGHSFAQIDPGMYRAYANWLAFDPTAKLTIVEGLTNLASLYVTGSYIYNDRFIVSASARSEFSNAFGSRSNERFLPIWSISGKWNMDKDWLSNANWVNLAALRVSYGTQGNMIQGQTPYTIITKWGYNTSFESFESLITHYPNPHLKWEKTASYDIGLDFSLFNNKLQGSVDVWYKRTSNAFWKKNVSAFNGEPDYVVNGGILENKGIDLTLRFTPFNNTGSNVKKRGFTWRIDPQLGQVFNKLLSNTLNGKNKLLTDRSQVSYQNYLNGTAPLNGEAVNTFYSYRFKGLDRSGNPVFWGVERENAAALVEKYNQMDLEELVDAVMVRSGRREPVIQGGISNYIGYRNWAFSFNLTYSLGNKIRLMKILPATNTTRPNSQENMRRELVNRWQNPGDEQTTTIPGLNEELALGLFGTTVRQFAYSFYQMYNESDLRVVSGDYLSLQSAALTWLAGLDLCTKMGVKSASITLGGSNLFTIANKALRGQSPTQSGISPAINLSVRPVYTFSIQLVF